MADVNMQLYINLRYKEYSSFFRVYTASSSIKHQYIAKRAEEDNECTILRRVILASKILHQETHVMLGSCVVMLWLTVANATNTRAMRGRVAR